MISGAPAGTDDADDLPGRLVPAGDADAAGFERFVEGHARELGRLAYLLLGDRDAADDLVADAFLAAWRQWDRVCSADHPVAYVRRIVVNMAGSRIRRRIRERHRLVAFHRDATEVSHGADPTAVVDVQAALRRLPARRRACVVLRYGFDLPEQEVAAVLGISVGTVKSQTSKGAAQFRELLGDAGLPGPPRPRGREGRDGRG